LETKELTDIRHALFAAHEPSAQRVLPENEIMKASLSFDLPQEEEEMNDAIHGSDWRAALEAIAWQVLCWEQGNPDGGPFPGHVLESPVPELRPVLDLITAELEKRGLSLER
jgi:hypothetical protein